MNIIVPLVISKHYNIDNYEIGYCPKSHPILCDENDISMGLCKRTKEDCNIIHYDNVIPVNSTSATISKFGYDKEHISKSCYNFRLNYQRFYDDYDELPKKFKIITMNILGLEKPGMVEALQMKKRLNKLADIIEDEKLDIICFQEMSDSSFNILKPRMSNYIFSEENFNMAEASKARNSKMDVFSYMKYRPKSIEIYSLGGNSGYDNTVIFITYPNIIVMNVYLQAGSKFSPGLGENAIHYSRCRNEQLKMIVKIINKRYKQKHIIMSGDFNTDLDGMWPEYKQIESLKLKDSYRLVNPYEQGYTEDTDKNLLRWNIKFQHKQFRYDGIFYNKLKVIKSYLIGTEPIDLNSDETELLINYIKKTFSDDVIEQNIKYKANTKLLQIWPSDHFGVVSKFSF